MNKAYDEIILVEKEPIDRGHMNPAALNSFDGNFMKATFTVTNAVPQYKASNNGPWNNFEVRISKYAQSTCGASSRMGTLYLLTGTSNFGLSLDQSRKPVQDTTIKAPYTKQDFQIKKHQVKLVTPNALWTAGCCVWGEPEAANRQSRLR